MTSPALISPIAALFPGPGEWTEDDYYPLADRGRLIELTDGNLEVLPQPTDFHQLILIRLSTALHLFVSSLKLGQVRFAPLPVRLWAGKVREPDLIFMSAAHSGRIGRYWGVPDLAVEILSEGTESKDRQIKRAEYAQAGIPEYWVIDPQNKTLELLRVGRRLNTYDQFALFTEADTLTSPTFPGFTVALTELFAH